MSQFSRHFRFLKRKFVVKMQTDPYLVHPETCSPICYPSDPLNVKRLHAVTLFHFFTPSRSFPLLYLRVSLNFYDSPFLYSHSRSIVRHARNEKLKNWEGGGGKEKRFSARFFTIATSHLIQSMFSIFFAKM